MKKFRGMPITGTNIQQSRRRPFVPDAKDTSADAQRFIQEPPDPFKDNLSTPQMPAPTHPESRANRNFATDGRRFGFQKTVRMDLPAIGGGFPSSKGQSSIISGSPRGGKRVAGRISTNAGPEASAKEMRRLRQTYPGIFKGQWRP